MKKIGFFGLLIFWMLCLGITVNGAMLSPAISVMQDDFEMIKTGVGINTVSFGEDDFKELLGDSDFTGIKVQSLPDASDGILKVGMKTVVEGDVIAREMLAALRFIPAEEGKTAVFHFLPQGTDYEKPFLCTVYMLDTLNFAPTAKASTLTAKENIPVCAFRKSFPHIFAVAFISFGMPFGNTVQEESAYTSQIDFLTFIQNNSGADISVFTHLFLELSSILGCRFSVARERRNNRGGVVFSNRKST
jgi:hypothetical protein